MRILFFLLLGFLSMPALFSQPIAALIDHRIPDESRDWYVSRYLGIIAEQKYTAIFNDYPWHLQDLEPIQNLNKDLGIKVDFGGFLDAIELSRDYLRWQASAPELKKRIEDDQLMYWKQINAVLAKNPEDRQTIHTIYVRRGLGLKDGYLTLDPSISAERLEKFLHQSKQLRDWNLENLDGLDVSSWGLESFRRSISDDDLLVANQEFKELVYPSLKDYLLSHAGEIRRVRLVAQSFQGDPRAFNFGNRDRTLQVFTPKMKMKDEQEVFKKTMDLVFKLPKEFREEQQIFFGDSPDQAVINGLEALLFESNKFSQLLGKKSTEPFKSIEFTTCLIQESTKDLPKYCQISIDTWKRTIELPVAMKICNAESEPVINTFSVEEIREKFKNIYDR